ncbi:MAG: hypothetical protein AAGE94_06790 [Acidobacteriota bacterium]
MPSRIRPLGLNPVGRLVSTRRTDLQIPRDRLPFKHRVQHLESTAKTWRALHLLRLDGSDEILAILGLELGELEALADGELSADEVLERARSRQPDASALGG